MSKNWLVSLAAAVVLVGCDASPGPVTEERTPPWPALTEVVQLALEVGEAAHSGDAQRAKQGADTLEAKLKELEEVPPAFQKYSAELATIQKTGQAFIEAVRAGKKGEDILATANPFEAATNKIPAPELN